MARKPRLKADARPLPQTPDACNALIAELGEVRRRLVEADADLERRVATLKAFAEDDAAPLKAREKELFTAIAGFCAAHRTALTDQGRRKTATFPAGTVSWRTTPPAVRIREADEVLARIRAETRFAAFLRTKVEIDREAMLKAPDLAQEIAGVTIGQREEFVVEPVGAALAPALPEAAQ